MIDITKLSPRDLERFIHVQSLVDRQQSDAAKIRDLRRYYDGDHPVLLTQRQQEFLGPLLTPNNPYNVPGQAKQTRTQDTGGLTEYDFGFHHNLLKIIIDTLAERLAVTAITVNGASVDDLPDDGSTPDRDAQAAQILWEWWDDNGMDTEEMRLYRRTLRDERCYVLVDYDSAEGRPRLVVHEADDGTSGITFHRDPSDMSHILLANRYWWTFDPLRPGHTGEERKTVYLPAEIRKYKRGRSGDWEPTIDAEGEPWPIPWVDRKGEPLGILAVEFANPGGSEIEQMVGLQNALNKAWLDLIAAADSTGFPLLVVEYDTSRLGPAASGGADDDNLTGDDEFRISPGRAIEVDDAHVHRLDPPDLTRMLEVIWGIVQAMSGVSRTPQYYLRPVGGGMNSGSQAPSGETLKQLESGLVSRAVKRQKTFQRSWAQVFRLAWRVADTFGDRLPELDPMVIGVEWTDPNVRNEVNEATVAEAHDRLGVPSMAIWQKLGYTPEQIQRFQEDAADERAADVAAIAGALQVQQRNAQPQTNPDTGDA